MRCQEYQYHLSPRTQTLSHRPFPRHRPNPFSLKTNNSPLALADFVLASFSRHPLPTGTTPFNTIAKVFARKPKPKKKHDNLSLHPSNELCFDVCPDSRQLKLSLVPKPTYIGVFAFDRTCFSLSLGQVHTHKRRMPVIGCLFGVMREYPGKISITKRVKRGGERGRYWCLRICASNK